MKIKSNIPEGLTKRVEEIAKAKIYAVIETQSDSISEDVEKAVKDIIQRRIYRRTPLSLIRGIDDDKYQFRNTYANTGSFKKSMYTYYIKSMDKGHFITKQLLPNSPPDAHHSWVKPYSDLAKKIPFFLDKGNNPNGKSPLLEYKGRRWITHAKKAARETTLKRLKAILS